MSLTLYWHDYETFGTDPRRDRAAQFAGVRTDCDFNIIGEPLTVYCAPAEDMLPQPEACLITGITPQTAARNGCREFEFIDLIHQQISLPGTCGVGYNSLRFDDEVTRNLLYRNFFDPYAREWRNGNSRWDLIDMVRLTQALRPEGIDWPMLEDGSPCFRLEKLAEMNGIEHQSAHDALSDVYATISLAKLIKDRQPRLYDFVFKHRGKRQVLELLQVGGMAPVIHISGMYSAKENCLAVVVALVQHPENKNEVVVYNLSVDPEALLSLDVDAIRQRVFSSKKELCEGVDRIALKTIHINKCPIITPLSALRPQDAERLGIELRRCLTHLESLKENLDELKKKLQSVYSAHSYPEEHDPDLMIYSGGFFSDKDRASMERVRALTPGQLQTTKISFNDLRLPEMLFRFRARNYPETLLPDEKAKWEAYRVNRLTANDGGGSIAIEEYQQMIVQLLNDENCNERNRNILNQLKEYGESLGI